jgi:hypothetical protein
MKGRFRFAGYDCGMRVKRAWVYVRRPAHFGMSGCECGNADPEWSEFAGQLWCGDCGRDFAPESGGVFDGPIGVNAARLLGIDFRTASLEAAP